MIEQILDAGFRVFMRDPSDSYCFYTDGKSIGYVQVGRFGGGYSISTVHVPNRSTGTGFQMVSDASSLTKENLQRGFVFAPEWASSTDRASVVKWRDIDHFRNADAWNRGLNEITKEDAQ